MDSASAASASTVTERAHPAASASPAAPPSRPAPELAGSLTVPRAGHSATLLASGAVLVAGGCTEDSCEGVTDSTELFVPGAGASAPGPSMHEPRVGHAAIALGDGRVLVVGGFGSAGVSATTELYDPESGTFVPGPSMGTPRADPRVFRLPDGSVVVIGGFDGRASLDSVERFDPMAGTFAPLATMSEPRSGAAAAQLADGRILVVGGRDVEGDLVLATAEVYDPESDAWTSTGDLSIRRHKHAVVALADGRALVIGGSDERDGRNVYRSTELFDPGAGAFAPGPELAEARYKIVDAVVNLPDGSVLVAGGGRHAERFDPVSAQFTRVGTDTGGSWSFATATILSDGRVFVAGGYDAAITVSDRVVLHPAALLGGVT